MSAQTFSTEVQKVHADSKSLVPPSPLPVQPTAQNAFSGIPIPPQNAFPGFPIPPPVFNPVINSRGMVNFTVNICPSGNITVGGTSAPEENCYFDELLEGIDLDDFP